MLTIEDLISPRGNLTEAMFPSGDLEEFAEIWLEEAVLKTSIIAAQKAWAYYRAYSTILDRVMLEASSERKADGSASRTDAQMAHWRKERDRHLAAFVGIVGSPAGGHHTPVQPVW